MASAQQGVLPTVLVHRPRCPIAEQIPASGMQVAGQSLPMNTQSYYPPAISSPPQSVQVHLAGTLPIQGTDSISCLVPQSGQPSYPFVVAGGLGNSMVAAQQSPTGVLLTAAAGSPPQHLVFSQQRPHHPGITYCSNPDNNTNTNRCSGCCGCNNGSHSHHGSSSGQNNSSVVHHVVHSCGGRRRRSHHHHHRRCH